MEDEDCPICLDQMIDPVKLGCDHYFCLKCIKEHYETIRSSPRELPPSAHVSYWDYAAGYAYYHDEEYGWVMDPIENLLRPLPAPKPTCCVCRQRIKTWKRIVTVETK